MATIETSQAASGRRSFKSGDLVACYDPLIWVLTSSAYKTRCASCLRESQELRTCSGCKLHRYCNVTCQSDDWKWEHKLECSLLKQTNQSDGSLETDRGPSASSSSTKYSSLDVPRDLIAKLINKFKLGVMVDIPGFGLKTAKELWNMLPSNPKLARLNKKEQLSLSKITDPKLGFSLADMVTFSANIAYNAMPIEDTLNGVARIGTAVYPLASPRLMTPVCWDTNVVLTFRGRRLTIHAVEDISNYTGQKDLRYNIMPEPFYMTRAERRAEFEKLHGYPCTCRKCSPQYDADINPLKCVNMGCPNRIPSDDRALQPCSECGALNKERLVRFRRFLQQHENVKIRFRKELHVPMMMDLCKEMDAVDILQPDAHIRYVCGWGLPRTLYDDNRFEEGWKMMQEFIVCARNIYPKYEVSRAIVLSLAGMSAAIALKKLVVQRAGQVPAAEKEQLQAMLDTACPVILNYSHESADIFVTLYGEFSKQAMERRDMLTRTIALVHDIKKVFRNSK